MKDEKIVFMKNMDYDLLDELFENSYDILVDFS